MELAHLTAVERHDLRIGRRLARGRGSAPVRAAAKAGKLGDQEPLYIMAAALTAAGVAAGDRRVVGAGVGMGLAVVAADLAKSALKRCVTRSRPHVLLDEDRYERHLGGSAEKPMQSFPSGHVAGAVAAAAALRRTWPRSWPVGALVCALLGWSRVAKGAHWPLDVAAGAIAGMAAEAATHRLILAGERRLPWRAR